MRRFSTHQNETPEETSSGVSFWAQSGILGGKGGGEMEYVPRHGEKKPLYDLPLSPESLGTVFARCADYATREISLAGGGRAVVCWVEGLVRNERLNDYVLRPLITGPVPGGKSGPENVLSGGVWNLNAKPRRTLDETAEELLNGSCAVFLPGGVVTCAVPTEEKRAVESPENETELKGAQDSFVESARTSASLVRRRLKSAKVKLTEVKVGRTSRTAVDVLWVEGVTNPELVRQVEDRVRDMDIDALLGAADIEEYLVDSRRTVFPRVLFTERPDRFCRGLMDGQVGVLADGIPMGCLLPCGLSQFLRAPQDRSYHWLFADLLILLRYACLAVTVLLPGFYIAMAGFHLQMIPTQLALSVIASKKDVPFSIQFEVLLMLLAFEVLQEAGLRLPRTIGQSVSIIGALVVGQAAVEAKIISPAVIIVVAAAGMAGFTMPNQDFANALRLWRFLTAVGASLAGLFGLAAGLIAMICQLARQTCLGVSYLAPFSPEAGQGRGGEWVLRGPMPTVKLRDLALRPPEKRRQK